MAGYSRGFHVTGIAGIFGAVATLGKLRNYTPEMLESAWGLALSKAAGIDAVPGEWFVEQALASGVCRARRSA